MFPWDVAGYVASALVLAAFYMKSMVWLRVVALLSNVAFIVYGLALNLPPIWLLHALLVPLNWFRLIEATRIAAPSRRRRMTRMPIAPDYPGMPRSGRRR
jgi:hypothetical protein